MTLAVIITLCSLLLIAYLFELSSARTKIPSVILLLLLGWLVRQVLSFMKISLPDFAAVLPIFGTIGLILIVLEGALELEVNRAKTGLIIKSFIGALFSMLAAAFSLAFLLNYFLAYPFKDSLVNIIPFCVISSAIAIPSVRNLNSSSKEFVIYESSLSDIIGVLLFNFIALNAVIDTNSFKQFGLELSIMVPVTVVATVGLSLLLHKIEHHIKFVPIILLIILIYTVSKVYHLPALIFILLFGLFIGNLDELHRFSWIRKLHPEVLDREVQKFKELTIEAAFLVRALFFLLFGYLLESAEILNPDTLMWSAIIVAVIFLIRFIQLKLSRLSIIPLLFVAPRGLITILLFLSIDPANQVALISKSLVIQVIILSTFIMMFGLMLTGKSKE